MRKLALALSFGASSFAAVASAQPAQPSPAQPTPVQQPPAPAPAPVAPAPVAPAAVAPAPPPPSAPMAPAAPAAPVAAPPPPAAASSDVIAEPERRLEFFEPASAFALPPPPPPPSPSALVSAFTRIHGFVTGSVHGVTSHVGASVGGRGGAFMLGVLPNEKWLSVGFEVPRFTGALLSSSGPIKVGLLGPSFESHLFTDFSDNVQMNLGASVLGLGISTCSLGNSGVGFFAQLRGPMVHGWIPIVIEGESDTDATRATPYLSIGGGLEAGLVIF